MKRRKLRAKPRRRPTPRQRKADDKADEAQRKAGDATDHTGDAMGDAALTTKVKTKFLADDDISGLKIDVDSKNGVVTLTGTVTTAAEKALALKVAKGDRRREVGRGPSQGREVSSELNSLPWAGAARRPFFCTAARHIKDSEPSPGAESVTYNASIRFPLES